MAETFLLKRRPPSLQQRTWPLAEPFEDVLGRACSGDDDAFAELWRWLQPPLLGWLRVVIPGYEDEVASETWIHVTKRLKTFRGGAQGFRSWVFTTARRRAVDETRRRRRRTVSIEELGGGEPPDSEVDPSLVAAGASGTAESLALVRKLPPAQAEVVMLRVVAGLSVSEAADATGRSEGAVRVLCHRGLQSLASLVEREVLVGP